MDSSRTSSTCSSPHNDSVEKVIKNDHVRYVRKGYGLIMAIIIASSFFLLGPTLLKMVYPSIIEGQNERWFACISVILMHLFTNVICYISYYVIYKAKTPFLERYKVLNKPWPWESHKEEWKSLLRDSILLFMVNSMFISPVLSVIDTHLNGVYVRMSIDSMPSIMEVVIQISFCMIVEDFCFYWGHRLLHYPPLYKRIHKIHHKYIHTVSIANEHAHPLEFALSNALPTFIGPKILGTQMHLITIWLWVGLRVAESVDGHSGYEFSWSPFRLLPLSGSSIYHTYHHSANVGNYGSFFTYWDTICKTNRHYFVWLARRQRESQLGEIKNVYADLKKKLSSDPSYKLSQQDEKNDDSLKKPKAA